MKFYLILLCTIVNICLIQCQTLKLRYVTEEKLTNLPPKLKVELGIRDGSSIYRIKSFLSIYPGYSKWYHDSVYVDSEEAEEPFKKVLRPKIIWKKYHEKQIYEQDLNFDQGQIVLVEPKNIKWNIDRSIKKEILGIPCIYASATKDSHYGIAKMEVWFTEEIPYPDGPENHSYSLPGLILEYKNNLTEKHIYVIEIEVVDINEDDRNFPKLEVVEADRNKRNQYYLSLDKSSKYILSEQSPQKKWIPYPKE